MRVGSNPDPFRGLSWDPPALFPSVDWMERVLKTLNRKSYKMGRPGSPKSKSGLREREQRGDRAREGKSSHAEARFYVFETGVKGGSVQTFSSAEPDVQTKGMSE